MFVDKAVVIKTGSLVEKKKGKKSPTRERLGAFTDHKLILQATSVCTVPDNKNFGVTLTFFTFKS